MKFSMKALIFLAAAIASVNAFPSNVGIHQVTAEEDAAIVRIGSVQAEPPHWNLSASIDKFCDFMAAAGEANMDIVTFSEGFISGYPWFNYWTNSKCILPEEYRLHDASFDLVPMVTYIKLHCSTHPTNHTQPLILTRMLRFK